MNWNFFEKIIYINLDRRQDRLKELEKQFQKVNIPKEKLLRFAAIDKPNEGWIGCTLSHIQVLEIAIKEGWKNYLVIEDDVSFELNDKYVKRKFNGFIGFLGKNKWDVAVFSSNIVEKKDIPEYSYIKRLLCGLTTGCYAVNSTYYETLLKNFKDGLEILIKTGDRFQFAIDVCWQILMRNDKWYILYPNLAYQRSDYSDIEKKYVDYKPYFYK